MLRVPAELGTTFRITAGFSRLRGREFDASLNEYSLDQRVRADVFVFAVQTQLDTAEYDMLDLAHWEFWVLDAARIRSETRKSVDID